MSRYHEGALRPESRRYVIQGLSALHVSRKIATKVLPLSYPLNLSTSNNFPTTQSNSTIRQFHEWRDHQDTFADQIQFLHYLIPESTGLFPLYLPSYPPLPL